MLVDHLLVSDTVERLSSSSTPVNGSTLFRSHPAENNLSGQVSIIFALTLHFILIKAHDSELHFCAIDADQIAAKKTKRVAISAEGQPILKGCFVNEDTYVGSGFDKAPMVFKKNAKGIYARTGCLDAGFNKDRPKPVEKEFAKRAISFDGKAS
jgi:hypothetical protein